jgi:hypothetical protein
VAFKLQDQSMEMFIQKGDFMPFTDDPDKLTKIETMLMKEMGPDGRIMVRSIDKIHARTGLNYAILSEIARRLQKRSSRRATA